MLSRKELEKLSEIDIKDIDVNNLQNLSNIVLNVNAPIEQRLHAYFEKINNPYCFIINNTPVQISFNDHNKTLEDSLFDYLIEKKKSDEII